jgi:hypothetical protein
MATTTALVKYKGMYVLSNTPTGTAGKALQNNFIDFANRIGPSVFANSNPTATSDENHGFYTRSRWLNTATGQEWICTDQTAGAASWALGGYNSYTVIPITRAKLNVNYGGYPGSFAQGKDGATGDLRCLIPGSFAQGYAKGGNILTYATGSFAQGYTSGAGGIYGRGAGSFAQGCSTGSNFQAGLGSVAQGYAKGGMISAMPPGSFAQGYAKTGEIGAGGVTAFVQGYAGGDITTTGDSSFAQGFAAAGKDILANGKTCFAQGYAVDGSIQADSYGFAQGYGNILAQGTVNSPLSFAQGSTQGTGIISSGADSFAQGYAANGRQITASGIGAFAQGAAITGNIIASGAGSFAHGAGGTIIASGKDAVQFGPGTNAEDFSLKMESGIHLVSGVPGAVANGMIYLDGADVKIRSRNATFNLTTLPAH